MNYKDYSPYLSKDILMGPSSLIILEELLTKHPLIMNEDKMILDLGCGKGLTSLILAKETDALIFANDLWIDKKDNETRFKSWKLDNRFKSFQEDANNLPFLKHQFDGLVSVDAYHYFGAKEGFFENKILPF